jgi:hypothetical protein
VYTEQGMEGKRMMSGSGHSSRFGHRDEMMAIFVWMRNFFVYFQTESRKFYN